MNGVSRFLSRRDKKHDKEKHRHRRVFGLSLSACSREACKRPSTSDSDTSYRSMKRRRRGSSLAFSARFLLPCDTRRITLPPQLFRLSVEVSTANARNCLTLQTKEISNDLYKIWSSDEDKKADKEEEKKVRESDEARRAASGDILMVCFNR